VDITIFRADQAWFDIVLLGHRLPGLSPPGEVR